MKLPLIAFLISMVLPAVAQAEACKNPVTRNNVLLAQQQWGDAIVAIGRATDKKAEAKKVIDTLYAYEQGPVLFKPTLAREKPFRASAQEALSYFVGGDIAEDQGFALAPFIDVRFDNEGIITACDTAISMGEYYFTKTDGSEVKAEYSFGYIQDEKGDLRINLHHSSLPYNGQ